MEAFILVLACYLIATVLYLLRLITNYEKLSAIALRVTMAAAVVHLIVLARHFLLMSYPFAPTFLEYFQVSALLLAVVFIGLCFFKKFYGSGPFFITLIDLFCIFSLTQVSYSLGLPAVKGYGYLFIHLSSIFLSMTVFSLSLVTAIMFLLSEWQIKNKSFHGIVRRFPSLAVLDDVHYKSLYAGFILFSVAILTGAGFSKIHTGHYVNNDIKQIMSIMSWFFFAMILNFRVRQGWQGHKGIVLSVSGFIGMVLLFIVGFS